MITKTAKLTEIKPNPNNPRVIKDEAFKKLVKSLKDFPEMIEAREIVVNTNMVILGGNMRYRAAKEAGIKELPVKIVDWNEEKQREFIIKDNVSGGEWDWDVLANEWDTLELEDWGLELPDDIDKEQEIIEDTVPELEEEYESEPGKVYKLGRHLLMCGDSTKSADVMKLMNSEKAALIHTDPPYGVSYQSNVHGGMENDNVTGTELYEFLRDAMNNAYEASTETCAAYIWHAHASEREFYASIEDAGFEIKQQIIWNKEHFVMGRYSYHWKHEPCYLAYKNGQRPYEAEERKSTTVWNSPETLKSMSKKELLAEIEKWKNDSTVWDLQRDKASEYIHPTQKPVAIPAKAILKHSKDGDVVLDLFAGSGSTIMACEQLGRRCYAMEYDPRFVDAIRKRWWKFVNDDEYGWQDATLAVEVGND